MKRTSHFELSQAMTSADWPRCEDLIKTFEESWQLGRTPAIQDYLEVDGKVHRPLLVELIHVDLEFRIKAGGGVRVESYFASFPEIVEDQQVVLELIAAEHDLRRRFEGSVAPEEYAERFPALGDTLVRRLSVAGAATQVIGPAERRRDRGSWPDVPGYEVVGEVGQGGMGIVYKARDLHLDRYVALKFLPPEFTDSSDRLNRFLREARTASGLNHPYICTVHSLGEHHDRPFIVMEFVEGRTLQSLAASRPDVASVTRWIGQVAQALDAAHTAGVVHRDIKPENIMIRADGYVKVLDFGLARRLPTLLAGATGDPPETDPGTLLGTVAFMSPEQTRGAPAESESDIFSLGVVAYQLLTARHPFEGETPVATLHAIASHPVVPPSQVNPELPAALSGLIEAMLHKDPQLRPTAAEVDAALRSAAMYGPARASQARARPIVRREPELAILRAALAAAETGRGSFVCVSGEPGIGKTTLMEDFFAEVHAAGAAHLVARGNCSERLANTEAYLPVLNALEHLLRADHTASAARILGTLAPTWYAQVAPVARGAATAALTRSPAASQRAMLREFHAFLQETARFCTLVLFFDDVHWADLSTVDLLAHLGHHCHDLRVLIAATFRPTELLLGPHAFHSVKLELQSRGVCTEVPLGFLDRGGIRQYLKLAFGNHAFPDDFADVIHARTEGNPLFMTDLLRDLCERKILSEADGRWRVVGEVPDLSRDLPQSVRGMIERKLDRLQEVDRHLLAAASVQGDEFNSLILADVLGWEAEAVEGCLLELDRVHGLVRTDRSEELPDGSLAMRYSFVHILYQQALYRSLLPTRRAALSLSAARALERRYTGSQPAIAAELAYLYEVGREYMRASYHFCRASQNAARVFAHGESVALARRGITLLHAVPVSGQRSELELALHTTLGLQLQVTQGYGAAAAKEAYERARQICLDAEDDPPMFPVLWGLWLHHKVRSELATAQDLAMELSRLARQSHDPDLALQAHQALAMTAFCRGQLETSLQHVEQAAALYDRQRHATHSFQFGQDPGVICKAFGAIVLWLQGYPDAAARQSAQAVRMSLDLSPSSQAVALYFAAIVHQLRRDAAQTRRCAEQCGQISAEHGFSFWLIGGNVLRGWALAAEGRPQEGLEIMRQALVDWESIGSVTYRTYFLGILAQTLIARGGLDEGRSLLDEAIALARQTDEGFYEPELHRLRGNCVIFATPDGDLAAIEEARHEFCHAHDMARRQGAKSLQLRAATSLAAMEIRHPGACPDGRKRLTEAARQITEGHQTCDLQEANACLSGEPPPERR